MRTRRVVSTMVWATGCFMMLPALASEAAEASEASERARQDAEHATPLESSQCFTRCSVCTTRCASMFGSERTACDRACLVSNDTCCESSGRHGAPSECACF